MKLAEQVGMNIRVMRIRRKLSQEKLAVGMGVERQQLSDIELGKRNLTLSTIVKICRALKCQPIDLFLDTTLEQEGKS